VSQKSIAQLVADNMPVIGLTLLSLVIVVFLAYRSASAHPPTVGEATALAVLAGIFQILASIVGVSKGRADPNFVKGAIMRLGKILLKAQAAAQISEVAFDQETTHSRRVALGQLSVILSFLQDETADAIRDWNNLYPDLIVQLAKEGGQDLQKLALNVQEVRNA
jgi:Na+/phosphate symporter